jgi:glycosyltransferase involved in cell wall biosynthesis
MKPVVSVIIPTRNRSALLREALDSVYAQEGAKSSFGLEVTVVDNASTDSTADVVSQYPETQYLRLPTNKGAAVARNVGIAASKGAYVAFLDDDDLWLPGKLHLQVPALEATPEAGAVYSRFVARWGAQPSGSEDVIPNMRVPPSGMVFPHLLMGNFCGNALGLLLRRSALEAVGGFDETLAYAEDYDLWLRLASHAPFAFVPGVVAVWRLSPHGHYATGIVDGSRVRTMQFIVEKALSQLPDTAAARVTRRRARQMWGINILREYTVYHVDLFRPLVLATLNACPSLVGSRPGRRAIAKCVRHFAMASPCPIAAVRSFCKDLRVVAGNRGVGHRIQVRRMLALVWAELAVGLAASVLTRREAASALIRSVLLDPSQVLQKPLTAVLRAVRDAVRSWMGRRWPQLSGGTDE